MDRYHVAVKYERPPRRPLVGPQSREAGDAIAAIGICEQGGEGDTTLHLTVSADDETAARAEGIRLADLWAAH